MKFLFKYIKKEKFWFSIAVFFLIVESLLELSLPFFMVKMIDNGVAKGDLDYVYQTGVTMLIITIIGAVSAILRNNIGTTVSQKIGMDIRHDLFVRIQLLELKTLQKLQASSLITRLTSDISIVQTFIFGLSRIFIRAPIMFFGSLTSAIILSPKLALMFIPILLILTIILIINIKVATPLTKKVAYKLDDVNMVVRDYLRGIRVVKSFYRYKYEDKRFKKANNEYRQSSINSIRVVSILSPTTSFILNVGIAVTLWFGGSMFLNDSIETGVIIAFINYLMQMIAAFSMLTMVFNWFVRAKVSSKRIEEVFDEEIEPTHLEETKEYEKIHTIQLRNVSYYYEDIEEEKALHNITLTIRNGEHLSIIGPTGSGKSTLLRLLLGLIEPTEGEIFINGKNMKEWELDEIRKNFMLSPQSAYLFSGSIRDNLLFANEDATDESIEEAMKIAKMDEIITQLPDGLESEIGQRGVSLSGGQKQRISLARALLKDSGIFVIDDSLGALDAITEKEVRNHISKKRADLTIIEVVQKLSSAMKSDNIIVLNDGKKVGEGNHEDLLSTCQLYKELYESQVGGGVSLS